MNDQKRHIYRFNNFLLNIAERQLLRGDDFIPLTPKVFDVLAFLVKSNGRLVEKDVLLRSIWEDAFVEEANIARIVHTLRKSLGETDDNKFIETVAKRGYRFIAEVKEVSGSLLPTTDTLTVVSSDNGSDYELPQTCNAISTENFNDKQESSAPIEISPAKLENVGSLIAPKESFKKLNLASRTLVTLLIFAFVAAGVLVIKNLWTAREKPEGKSIAVLPLKPIDTASRDTIYELGIAESLIFKLGSAENLTVRPLSATRKYLELDQNSLIAGQEQKVDYVLASNYQIADGKIRVTSQLINIRNEAVEKIFKSETDVGTVFSTQDALANEIGSNLLAQFGYRGNNRTAKRETNSEEAYRLYLYGMYIIDQVDNENLVKAREHFEQAVKLDPDYAQAYVGLTYAHRWAAGAPLVSGSESKAAADKALALNPDSADAHVASALTKVSYDWNFDAAETEYRRAIALDPNSSQAHALYSFNLVSLNRSDQAILEIEKAIEIDPNSTANQVNYGIILYYAHRYDESIAQFKRILEKDPNLAKAYFWMWLLYDLKGDGAAAYEWFMKHQTQIKAAPETIEIYRNAYQKAGWNEILRERIKQGEKNKTPENAAFLHYEAACLRARLGENDRAFELLNRAFEQRSFGLMMIKADPFLDSLQFDPRFDELVGRVGLK